MKASLEPVAHIIAYREHVWNCEAYGIRPVNPLILAALAMPLTHKVVTTYADGRVREFATRSRQTADNHAVLDRRNIGRDLIVRGTEKWSGGKLVSKGRTVRIVSVEVVEV